MTDTCVDALIERSGMQMLSAGSQKGFMRNLKRFSHVIPRQSAVYFPSSVSSVTAVGSTSLWYMTVVEPITASRCSIRRTLYTTRPEVPFAKITNRVALLEAEFNELVKRLESRYQDIIKAETPVVLSPSQNALRDAIKNHVKNERAMGRKISPALPLEIAGRVNSTKCDIAEKCESCPQALKTLLTQTAAQYAAS